MDKDKKGWINANDIRNLFDEVYQSHGIETNEVALSEIDSFIK